jgi:hypothetical protein
VIVEIFLIDFFHFQSREHKLWQWFATQTLAVVRNTNFGSGSKNPANSFFIRTLPIVFSSENSLLFHLLGIKQNYTLGFRNSQGL